MLIKHALITALLLLLFLPPVKATHIVGGEMNYTCLGDDLYEITLTIFRDCFNGNPNAWFDDPASIGVFDENNILLEEILIPLMNNDTLSPVLSSECLVVPPDVCVHTSTYTTTINLPSIPGGYQLAYQRCCRNQTIVNIIDPLDTGATYGVTITEEALNACNSNPKFKEWPPIYICVGEPIVFDQSAIDQDGDSIVYRLCTPLSGANPDIPQPQPPNNPPYSPISWVNPPYSVDNMLNSTPTSGVPLSINEQTGLLTGLPNTIGQFVVGICVEEYRDGILMSTTRRDFQYNVGLCGQANAAFMAPEIQCGSLTVVFENESQGTSNFIWNFNDPGNPGATSTAFNPVYTFSDTGVYNIMLIAAPGEVCEDTVFQEISLQENTLDVNFDFTLGPCSDSVRVLATDLSTDTIHGIESWEWTLLPTGLTSDLPNPEFILTDSGLYVLNLLVTSSIGCTQAFSQEFAINTIQEELIGDTVVVCQGDSINLNPIFNEAYDYHWAPNGEMDDLQLPNPVVSPDITTTYTVSITDSVSDCEDILNVTVFVPVPVQATLPEDTTICSTSILLESSSNTGETFLWSENRDFFPLIADTESYLAMPRGLQTYYLQVRDSYGCVAIDSVAITGNAVDIAATSQLAVCPGDFGAVAVINLDTADILSIDWTPEDLIAAGQTNTTAFVFLETPGIYPLYVEATNQFGCTAYDSTTITVIDTTDQISFLMEVQCSGYTVLFNSSSINSPFYNWAFGDPQNPTASSFGSEVSYTYPGPGTYEVVVTLSSFIQCPDTLITQITIGEPNIIPAFDWSISTCSDSISLQFTDESVNNQSDIVGWQWIFSNGDTALVQDPLIILDESQELEVQLFVTSSDGCVDSTSQLVPVELPVLNVPDTIIACIGEMVSLNPEASPLFTYQWSPAIYFEDVTAVNPQVVLENEETFNVIATSLDNNCVLERSIFAFVPPMFDYELPNDTTLCEEDFLLYADVEVMVEVLWESVIEGDTTFLSAEPEVLVMPNGSTQYLLTMTDEFGCSQLDSIHIANQPIITFLPESFAICLGDTIELQITNLLGNSLTYEWSPEVVILEGANTADPLVAPVFDQEFSVTITNSLGCTATSGTQVLVTQNIPPLDIIAEPDTVFQSGEVQLEATFDTGYTYEWSPATGLNNISIFDPLAQVDSSITYQLMVKDESGCTNEDSITIRVITDCLPPFIYVPNAFSPNGDNLNDELFVRGNTIDELYFAIYNRWGQLVFETDNQNVGWNGTFKGKDLPPDSFGYYLEVRCFNGETYFEKGNISLIR
jgi:gliding motility-associated-like protein